MRYMLEIIDEELGHGYSEHSTIESDSYIPIPEVGERIDLTDANDIVVVSRRWWIVSSNKANPLFKAQITCRQWVEPST